MATYKNWALEAAKEIADEMMRTDTVDSLAMRAILVKHIPFEEGVAYMPVPRCDSCKQWTRFHSTDDGLPTGFCPVILHTTAGDFGCVQWEEK